jgi:hypothetical protein
MPDAEAGTSTGKGSSQSVELVILLMLIVVFIAGIVWLLQGGVDFLKSDHGFSLLTSEGATLTSRMEKLVSDARRFDLRNAPDTSYAESQKLDFLSDLDGDPATGSYRSGGLKGLERVVVRRAGEGSRFLIADVYSSPTKSPSRVVLTSRLDRSDPAAFAVDYRTVENKTVVPGVKLTSMSIGSPVRINAVRFTARLIDQGEVHSISKSMRLNYTPELYIRD